MIRRPVSPRSYGVGLIGLSFADQAKAPAEADITARLRLAPFSDRKSTGAIEIGAGVSGHAVFGPYMPLEAGRYRLHVDLIANPGRFRFFGSSRKVALDVAVQGGNRIIANKAVEAKDLKAACATVIEFEILPARNEEERTFEFRLWTDGTSKLSLNRALLEKV
jgi:hypothetical protein